MPRRLFNLIAFSCLVLLCFTAQGRAQSANVDEREAEWRNYKVPASEFRRHLDPSKKLLFRAPADWQQQGDQLAFKGPDGAELQIVIEEIPDGIDLKSYVLALFQGLRGLPEGPDSIITRRVQLSGVEAQELLFEVFDIRGEVTKSVMWTVVEGPRAITFIFKAPIAKVAELEPYFKGVAQSALLIGIYFSDDEFEILRSQSLIEDKPTRIDEVQSFAETLNGLDPVARSKAIEELASIYASSPDMAIDLLMDRRAMVRAGAVEAIGLSGNQTLSNFLLNVINQGDMFVVDRAARAFARMPNAVESLVEALKRSPLVAFQRTVMASAYLDLKQRSLIAAELFKAGEKVPSLPPPPPPPPAARSRKRTAPPKTPLLETFISGFTIDDLYINHQFIAINLLRDIPADEFKMPLAQIIAKKKDRVTAAALQIALERRESLPVNTLLLLLDSLNDEIPRLAILHIGQSGTPSDIQMIEARAQKLSAKQPYDATRIDAGGERRARLAEDLRLSIEKIRLRQQLAAADEDARHRLIEQTMKNPRLADWAWTCYLRDELEGPKQNAAKESGASASDQPSPRTIQPLGENIFPEKVKYYAALPNLSVSMNRFGDALNNLQMDSAQGQARFVLILSVLKQQAARFFEAPVDSATLDYIGIDPGKPLAMATWTAEGAPRGLASAERKAFIARVQDRDRFERSLALYQMTFGNFSSLPETVSVMGRMFSLLPALMPLGAASAIKGSPEESKDISLRKYYLTGRDRCNGYEVKIIERRKITLNGTIASDAIYLAYAGDAAVLAPDWHSLRDALSRLSEGEPGIARNPEFKRAVEAGGDLVYMSDLSAVFADAGEKESDDKTDRVMESGALRISNATFENSFNITFKEASWTKSFLPFKPQQAAAPRELLPRSTVMYLLMDLNIAEIWRKWATDLFSKDDAEKIASFWAMDFEKEVAPELGKESGLAFMELPDLSFSSSNTPMVLFFKLKTDKLAEAFRDGKLFKNVSKGSQPARLKLNSFEFDVAISNGYMILSMGEGVIEKLDEKEKLAETRDFLKAIKTAPAEVIAFGGYNLEAALANIKGKIETSDMESIINAIGAVARAFHSQIFYALPDANGINARTSVSLDREGRYSVAELSSLSKDFRPTYAVVEAKGIPIGDQQRLDNLTLRVRSKGAGILDRISADVTSAHQTVEKRSEEEMVLSIRARRPSEVRQVELPFKGEEFASFLQSTRDILPNEPSVIEQAREIAGEDRDAWSVARKLADWTYKNLKWKGVARASAADTLATREADCTEFSQLFVAMARSLGLPARMVLGMAYDGNSFGGHAWIEVYAGEWIEMDPTWGTEFVDATHIRGDAGDMLSYAALNLLEIEVLEAIRGVPDFQRDATALSKKLCQELPVGQQSALVAALDLSALTDRHMGAGAWAKMSEGERQQIYATYRRIVFEITTGFEKDEIADEPLRLLKVTVEGDRAEALAIYPSGFDELLIKIRLARVGDAWTLVDIIQTDTGLHIISDALQPTIRNILEERSGKQTRKERLTPFARILIAMSQDTTVALELADRALEGDPKNRDLRYLKSLALTHAEKGDEAAKIWTELSEQASPLAPALLKLAGHYSIKEEEREKAIELYLRYLKIEPDDPRPHSRLAGLRWLAGDATQAEAAYREAIRCDPTYLEHYTDLAEFLATEKRYLEALAAIDEGAKHGGSGDELLNSLLASFYLEEQGDLAEELIAVQPERLEKNADANFYLGHIRVHNDRPRDALPLLKKSLELNPDSAETHNVMAEANRALRDWRNALASADAAIKIDDEDAEAHYYRACALAQLRRKTAAIAALKRAIEIDEDWAYSLKEEEDLKSLANLAEFKKLLPKEDK